MKTDFIEVARPKPEDQPRGGRGRSKAVDAVLATTNTERAIKFPNEKRARSVRFSAGEILKREHPELVARRSVLFVWVEHRTKGRGR